MEIAKVYIDNSYSAEIVFGDRFYNAHLIEQLDLMKDMIDDLSKAYYLMINKNHHFLEVMEVYDQSDDCPHFKIQRTMYREGI